MRSLMKYLCLALLTALLTVAAGCNTIDDDRIPAMPVNINLGDVGMWNTYGVTGFGIYRYFILTSTESVPRGFPYKVNSATGFGGIMLIGGMDPYTTETNIPLAYDLACPVECRQDIRVYVDEASYEAVCPVCGSRYDVTMAGGAPTGGPALTGKHKYALKKYNCIPTQTGGYMITGR